MGVVVLVVAVGLRIYELPGWTVWCGYRVEIVVGFPTTDDDGRRLGTREAGGNALPLESREIDEDYLLLFCKMNVEPLKVDSRHSGRK